MVEPVNCACGRKASVVDWSSGSREAGLDEPYIFVACDREECWASPVHKTRASAIKAWNKVMGRKL